MKNRLQQIAIGVDQLVNACLPGGFADETLSARAWRCRRRPGWKQARQIIDGLFFWQRQHCRTAFESEWARRQLPVEYRPEQHTRFGGVSHF